MLQNDNGTRRVGSLKPVGLSRVRSSIGDRAIIDEQFTIRRDDNDTRVSFQPSLPLPDRPESGPLQYQSLAGHGNTVLARQKFNKPHA
jgi:hypothetical protein